MTGPLLALALAAIPAARGGADLPPPPALAQEEWPRYDQDGDEGDAHRLSISAWGGEAFDVSGSGASASVVGGEVAWAFDQLDLGVAGYGWRGLPDASTWTPVALVRLTQRFPMRSGIEAAFGLGLGAARPRSWEAWFQVALGVRYPLGPMFLGGELAFERGDLLRLAAALGVRF